MSKRAGPMSELNTSALAGFESNKLKLSEPVSLNIEQPEQVKEPEVSNEVYDEANDRKLSNPKSSKTKGGADAKGELSSVFRLTPLSMFMNNKVSASSMMTNGDDLHRQSQQNLTIRNQLNLNLPVSGRRVRDSAPLLLMLCFLSFLGYIIWDGIVVRQSNVDLVVHGYDSHGNICGQNNKAIRFVEKSGKNYSDKPYTKYTLINSYFERYELVSDRLTNPNEIYFVKDNVNLVELRNQVQRMSKMNDKIVRSDSKVIDSKRALRLLTTLEELNRQRSNQTAINILKASFMYQYPPSYQSNEYIGSSRAANALNQSQVRKNIQFNAPLASTRTDMQTSDSISYKSEPTKPKKTTLIEPEDESFDHIMVNGTAGYNNSPRPKIPDIIAQSDAANQLLYLTECVDTCPSDHLDLIFYRCIPKNWRFSLFPNAINVTRTFIDDVITDIGHCYRELIYIFSFALALSLALLILLRFLASFIIWSCISLLVTLLVSTAGYSWLNFYYQIIDLNDMTPHDSVYGERLVTSDKWLVGSIFLTFVALASIVGVIIMRKRILLVTTLFKESGKAIGDMPLLLLQPLLTFAALVMIVSVWSIALICLQSIKIPVIDRATGFVVYKSETFYKVMKWYHFFAFLWVSHFAIACQHYVIGASVSKWYFATDRYNLHSPIGSSVSELILYYLGSVALGSFLVAIFKVIRMITRQIQYLVQRNCMAPSNSSSTGLAANSDAITPPLTSSCFGSLSYVWRLFVWFFDKIVMIISRDAYVEIAIHGYSFIGGAQRAFTVLASNPLRLLAIKAVSNLLLTVAKICVVFGTISMALLLVEEKSNQLNYSWSPIIISALYAYIVAHWFLSVYEMVIDALFICYCEDYERSKTQDRMISNYPNIVGSNFMTQILRDVNNNGINSGQLY